MKTKTILIGPLGLALALSSCASNHARSNGSSQSAVAPSAAVCPAPASIVGKTLHIDARKATYKLKLAVPSEDYAEWRQNAINYVWKTNSYDYSFRAGGRLKGCDSDMRYAYSFQGCSATVEIQFAEGAETIKLDFMTPTSGTATVVDDGAIGSEYDNIIYMFNMPFTLK